MPDTFNQISFETIILTILAVLVMAICVGCLYAFVKAIWMFIFSSGDSEKIKSAYTSIRFMVLGIVLTVGLLFLFPLLFKWMNVPNSDAYSARSIFNRAGELIRSLTEMGVWVKEFNESQNNKIQPSPSPTPMNSEYVL